MKYVNLGCGNRFNKGQGWVNIDFTSADPSVKAHNLRDGIPLPDDSADAVYHSHLLEHFSREEAPFFLAECRRVLKPGCVLRVVTPDLEGVVRAYLKSLEEARMKLDGADERHEWMTIELFDQMVREKSGGEMLKYFSRDTVPAKEFVIERLGTEAKRIIDCVRASRVRTRPGKEGAGGYLHGLRSLAASALKGGKDPDAIAVNFRRSGEIHRWMYDGVSLKKLLMEAGFTGVVVRSASESYMKDWAGQGLDTEPDGSTYKPDSLFMEGLKPGK